MIVYRPGIERQRSRNAQETSPQQGQCSPTKHLALDKSRYRGLVVRRGVYSPHGPERDRGRSRGARPFNPGCPRSNRSRPSPAICETRCRLSDDAARAGHHFWRPGAISCHHAGDGALHRRSSRGQVFTLPHCAFVTTRGPPGNPAVFVAVKARPAIMATNSRCRLRSCRERIDRTHSGPEHIAASNVYYLPPEPIRHTGRNLRNRLVFTIV
jgi:hypothetical protein